MGKQYNTELQAKVETYMKETGISQAKLAPMMNLSGAVLSQYRRSVYDKGDVGDVERKIREFFQIKEEQAENAKKTESFNAVRGYVATSISESIYKMIRYCQLEKGIVVIDGDAGIGKTKAATKFLRDNPATAIYISTTPSTSSVRSLLRMIARALKISENQRTEDLSISIRERLRSSDNVLIIDEAQNLKFMALEEIRGWVDEDPITGKPGIGIALIGNDEVYNKMLGRQEAIFSQQFNRTKLHGRYRATNVTKEDVEKLFPSLVEKGMTPELTYLYNVGHSKWGVRGIVNVFTAAANNQDVSLEGLQKVTGPLGIYL